MSSVGRREDSIVGFPCVAASGPCRHDIKGLLLRFLVLEDDAEVADDVVAALSMVSPDADVTVEQKGESALEAALGQAFDCLVFDRMVIGLDGLSVLAALRAREVETPALILSSLADLARRTEGLDGGADDYLTKPFAPEELAARVRALLRRSERVAHPKIRRHGSLELATKTRVAYWDEREISLTPKEFDILLALSEHHPDVVSLDMLWRAAWPDFTNLPPQLSVIHVTMSRLRAKLLETVKADLINTIKTKGYSLAVGVSSTD